MTTLTDFDEQSSGTANVTITDEFDDIVPATSITSLTYTLTTSDGNTIINSREQVDITPIVNPAAVVLQGDDLEIFSNEQVKKDVIRLITIEAIYDSLSEMDLPAKQDAQFIVKNLNYIKD